MAQFVAGGATGHNRLGIDRHARDVLLQLRGERPAGGPTPSIGVEARPTECDMSFPPLMLRPA